jgi:AraC family transcriptional regulator
MATEALSGGSFYGAVVRKQERHGAIFTKLRHTAPRKLPAHTHELAFFALQLGGEYRERYGGEQVDYEPFTVAFRPAGIPHQDEVGPRGVKLFEIELRQGWQERIEECSGTLSRACDDRNAGEFLWLSMQLFRETEADADELVTESLLCELVGKAGRVAHENRQAPAWLARVKEKLHGEFCERITLETLAAEAGVHPVHLSRVFRKFHGTGIGEYVRRLRIRMACRRMLEEEAELAEVALEAGFADQSHFTREFRRVTGSSPSAFRRLLAS